MFKSTRKKPSLFKHKVQSSNLTVWRNSYNSIHLVKSLFTSFFSITLDAIKQQLASGSGESEKKRRKEIHHIPHCSFSCLGQEQWEEEHLSWIKDGSVHWMKNFNYRNGLLWLNRDRKATGDAQNFDKKSGVGGSLQHRVWKDSRIKKKFFFSFLPSIHSTFFNNMFRSHCPISVLLCPCGWAFTWLFILFYFESFCDPAFPPHFTFKLDHMLLVSAYTSLPTASSLSIAPCFHQWI